MQMEDGATINFTMCAFTKDSYRKLRIMGTHGEIEGDMEKNRIWVKPFVGKAIEIDVNSLSDDFSGHGGGDVQMIRELIELILDSKTEGSAITTVEQSMESHYVAFGAEESRIHNGKVIEINAFVNNLE